MIVIGLTGSLAMGKSTVARQFARCGAAICDADAIVKRLLGKGGAAVEAVRAVFPAAYRDGRMDHSLLGQEVFQDAGKLRVLEAILHPRVQAEEMRFIRKARLQKRRAVVLEIPLLFETGAEERCDAVVVVDAPAFLQHQRARARGMSEERLHAVRMRQMPAHTKRRLADFLVFTGLGKYNSLRTVKQILHQLT